MGVCWGQSSTGGSRGWDHRTPAEIWLAPWSAAVLSLISLNNQNMWMSRKWSTLGWPGQFRWTRLDQVLLVSAPAVIGPKDVLQKMGPAVAFQSVSACSWFALQPIRAATQHPRICSFNKNIFPFIRTRVSSCDLQNLSRSVMTS